MKIPVIETENLLIRPFIQDDLELIHAVMNDGFGEGNILFRTDWLQWTMLGYKVQGQLAQPPYGERAVILKSSDIVIGAIGVVQSYAPFETLPYFQAKSKIEANKFSTPEIGLFWVIDSQHRGHHYASEAAQAVIDVMFNQMNLKRIVATTEYDNPASIAVMKRLGMSIERNPNPEVLPEWFQITGILENTNT